MSLPWFRMYSEWASDPVVQSLSFDDQRHHAVLLCLKCNGTLDRDIATAQRERIILRGLGLDAVTAGEVKRRLLEVGLINKSWQPNGWDKRQFSSRHGVAGAAPEGRAYIYFIGATNGDKVKIGYSKNPWARLKDFQTATTELLRVVATVSTTENSETHIHKLLKELRIDGEWYSRNGDINNIISEIDANNIQTDYDVANYVAQLRATTTDTEQIQSRTDTDKKNIVRLPPDVTLAVEQKPKNGFQQEAKEIIEFLNLKTGKNYLPVKVNVELITARIREGYTPDQLRQVVAKKFREWSADEKMVQYLRPKTLFNRTNFANYAGELVPQGGN